MTEEPNTDETYGNDLNWRSKWTPTPKWIVAFTVGAGAIASAFVEAGKQWNDTLSIIAIGFAVERITAYVAPNHKS